MAVDFDHYGRLELERRQGVKWHRDGGRALPAWIADMDFPIAREISAALTGLIASDDLGYPDPSLDEEVRTTFAARQRARYGLEVDPGRVAVVSDVVQAIHLVIMTLTAPGDGVVFLTPAYPPFFSAVEATGRRTVTCDLMPAQDRYEIDFAKLRQLVARDRPRLLLLCNPHNPTGRSFSRAELMGIAEIAAEHEMLVLSDEIHADLTLPGAAHTAYGSVGAEAASRTITVSSASKAFNLAGLRCAVAAFGSQDLWDQFDRFPAHARGSASAPGMLAAVTAWRHGDPWLNALLQVLARNREFLEEFLGSRAEGVVMRRPQATYLAWLDLRALGTGADPAAWLLERAGVALSPGPTFGEAGTGHARLNFATSMPVLRELLERVVAALPPRD